MKQNITNKEKNEILMEDSSFDKVIEQKRQVLFSEYTKSRKVSNILTFVVIAIAIGGMYLVTSLVTWMVALGWALLILGLIGMILFYFFNKRKFENHTKEYIALVSDILTNATFASKDFDSIEVTEEKFEISSFENNGAYKDTVKVASRNVVKGKYRDFDFVFGDAALFRKGEKKNQSVVSFVGKYLKCENKLLTKNNFLIQIEGDKPVDIPNDIENKDLLLEEGKIKIYGIKGTNINEVLGAKFLSAIKKIPVNGHLLNCAISISEKSTSVFISYDDDVVAIPFDKPFNFEAFNGFVNDLEVIFKAVTTLE